MIMNVNVQSDSHMHIDRGLELQAVHLHIGRGPEGGHQLQRLEVTDQAAGGKLHRRVVTRTGVAYVYVRAAHQQTAPAREELVNRSLTDVRVSGASFSSGARAVHV